MEPTTRSFLEQAKSGIEDQHVHSIRQRNLRIHRTNCKNVAAKLPEFEALKDASVAIRDHVLEHLDLYLEEFERKVTDHGGTVHWCRTSEEARDTILEICKRAGAKTTTKGKSMITEEIGLNDFLAENGIEPIETDLGEHIVQIAGEKPSHMLVPAAHKSKDDIADLFLEQHKPYGKTVRLDEVGSLVAQARDVLRSKYFEARVGITGANFLVAETGSCVLVTNEGNGDLTQLLTRVNIVVSSIEKVVPTLEDAATLLRVLARSAAAQEMTSYTSFTTGPKRPGDREGPEEFHVVLLDNGRAKLLGAEVRPLLRCIRCAACINHCPVYESIGGHAYGWVYQGPIGAALTPALLGVETAHHLAGASSFCGRCEEVCPVRIPLTRIMLHWRELAFTGGVTDPSTRLALKLWGFIASRPKLYQRLSAIASRWLSSRAKGKGRLAELPFLSGWTKGRDLPAPSGPTFQAQWKKRRGA
jgi:L-lactate dehydrogenase complex protein LldF